ncbi:MAG: sulfite exporter TauE/SafE family protein, partial [Sulfurovum sp.]
MVIELILVGIFIGTMSGFFGIGGGMILVPILLALGFEIKDAIGISIVQMV